jgi:hypothetical protein
VGISLQRHLGFSDVFDRALLGDLLREERGLAIRTIAVHLHHWGGVYVHYDAIGRSYRGSFWKAYHVRLDRLFIGLASDRDHVFASTPSMGLHRHYNDLHGIVIRSDGTRTVHGLECSYAAMASWIFERREFRAIAIHGDRCECGSEHCSPRGGWKLESVLDCRLVGSGLFCGEFVSRSKTPSGDLTALAFGESVVGV